MFLQFLVECLNSPDPPGYPENAFQFSGQVERKCIV